jgi:putative LysE/RhtB family amino acid efflux pump
VFSGSLLWWLVLTGGASLARHRVTPAVLRVVNAGSGILLLGFGAVLLAGSLAVAAGG